MEGSRPASLALRWIPWQSDQRHRIRPFRHTRAFHSRLRNHRAQIRGLVQEACAYPCAASANWLARSARETISRRRRIPHRTRHAPRSRNAHDPASSARHHHTDAHRHLGPARLRQLRLPILRERPHHHRLAPYQFSLETSLRRPRRRLQRFPPRRPERRSPGLHPRPLSCRALQCPLAEFPQNRIAPQTSQALTQIPRLQISITKLISLWYDILWVYLSSIRGARPPPKGRWNCIILAHPNSLELEPFAKHK